MSIIQSLVGSSPSINFPPGERYEVILLNDNTAVPPQDGSGFEEFKGKLRRGGGWIQAASPQSQNTEYETADGITHNPLPTAPWDIKHSHIYRKINGILYCFLSDVYNPTDFDVWSLDESQENPAWTFVETLVLPQPQSLYFSNKFTEENGHERIFFGGGQEDEDSEGGDLPSRKMYAYDENGLEEICDLHPDMGVAGTFGTYLSNAVAIQWKKLFLVIGGGQYALPPASHSYSGKVWAWDGTEWHLLADNPVYAVQYASVESWDDVTFFAFGSNTEGGGFGDRREIYWFNHPGNPIRITGDSIVPPRHASVMRKFNDGIHFEGSLFYNDSFRIQRI